MDLTIVGREDHQPPPPTAQRDYRKGNWSIEETMVLIDAKKKDDERRMRRDAASQKGKLAELRWKWVEDYCWKNGCLRSQNQCNDKWDNLMRDFKKVREYERRSAVGGAGGERSYWKIEKNKRRDSSLPSNMLLQIYEALVEVAERRDQSTPAMLSASAGSSGNADLGQYILMPPPLQQQGPPPLMMLPLPPPPSDQPQPPYSTFHFSQPLPTVDSDTSDYSESPAKRRRRRKKRDEDTGGEGTSGGGGSPLGEIIGSAISQGASMMAKAIRSREEGAGRRHGEAVSMQERRLRMEESKAEMKREGMSNLVNAINKLSHSFLAFAAHKK